VFGALAITAALAAAPPPATLVAAGDVASCVSDGDERTATLVARIPGTLAVLGDSVYRLGTPQEFEACYAPSWGRFRARTRPAAGNHEYGTPGAAGYFAYFGARAGHPDRGYYAYRLGSWRVIVLNSNCTRVGGCGPGSPQLAWLRAELATNRSRCTLAYWHHPRFSSGLHGNDLTVAPFWSALYAARAELVLTAHDHHYERFAPLTPAGRLAPARGLREFVVGTGGRSHYPTIRRTPGSQVREWQTFGVLRVTLRTGSYGWRFVPVAGSRFTDAGSERCR
jgi:Calcineurin-like phosphoesterase